ncbi:MAG: manganese efflux pump [Bacteroidales bacterium]
MDLLIIFIIALALAMDCFGLSIANSSVSGLVKPGVPLKTALLFAMGHLILLQLGFWLGGLLRPMFEGMEAWGAFVIFSIIGIKMIRGAQKRRPETRVFDINSVRVMTILALATSMDALLAGIALKLVQTQLVLASVVVTLAAFLFTLAGLAGGSGLGLPFARRTTIFGGVFMFIAAFYFLIGFVFLTATG